MSDPYSFLPFGGSMLLYGAPASYQSILAFDLACCVGRLTGRSVVYLVDGSRDANQVLDNVIRWRLARNVGIGERVNVSGIEARDLIYDPAKIAKQLHNDRPKLIVRDIATYIAPLDTSDAWLTHSGMLAEAIGCPVLTVAHTGPVGQPDLNSIVADEVWSCSAFHSKERQSGVNVRLRRLRPAAGDKIDLAGNEGAAITFMRIEDVEQAAHPMDFGAAQRNS